MKKNLNLTVMLLLSAWVIADLSAQTDILITSFLIRDDNTYKAKTVNDDWINTSTIHLGHRFMGETYQLNGYYRADVSLLRNNRDLNNYAHKFAIAGFLNMEDYSVHFSAFAKIRDYQEQFVYYNVNSYNLTVNLRYTPNLKNIYSVGFTINKDKYQEFGDLDNFSYRIYGKYQRFFQSRLSVTGEASLGIKNYVNQSIFNFYGYGERLNFMRYTEDAVRAALFSFSANIGKSITSRMGINLSFGGKWYIGDPIMTYSDGIYYYTENDLYDDPYSYEDRYVSLQLTRQFAIGFQGKLGVKYQMKNYSGTPALDAEGDLTDDNREDKRSEYFLLILKKFNTGWRFPSSFDVFFNYLYRSNPSNDPYYNFKDHIAIIGFSVGI